MKSRTWRNVTLGEFVRLQRGHDLTDDDRRPGKVPVMGTAGMNGYHDTAIAKGLGVVIGRSGASFGKAHYCPEDYRGMEDMFVATPPSFETIMAEMAGMERQINTA